jgi:hypothetical protein
MKASLSLAVCAALVTYSLLNPVAALSQENMVSLDDIILLAESDVSDQTIMTFLWYRQLDFVLDSKGIQRLRAAGVSDDVIRYLLEQDATAIASVPASVPASPPAYVVPTGYRTAYPSYYYGARLVGTTVFPLGWYDHHYFGFSRGSVYSYPLHDSESHGLGHSVGIGLGHSVGIGLDHSAGIGLGHSAGIGLGHSAGIGLGHSGQNLGHSGGQRRSHSGGRSGGHSGGRSGGHSGGHGGGH